jgi:acyl-CoA-binding protein
MSQADSDLETAFEAACQFVGLATTNKSLSVTDDQLLRFYGLYKQATAGACDAAKPSFFDRRGRAKWRAWHSCKCLSSSQAQQQYVHLLTELHPGWSEAPSSSNTTKQKQGGVGVPVQSRMADAQEEDEVGGSCCRLGAVNRSSSSLVCAQSLSCWVLALRCRSRMLRPPCFERPGVEMRQQ